MSSRLPALISLVVALFVGAAPWRVCSHAAEGHARVYLPGDHELLGHADGHDHHHLEHEPCETHCHCDDQRLLPGATFHAVSAPPPALIAETDWFASLEHVLVARAGASEVVPAPDGEPPDSSRCRAHEEDPTVLIR